MMKQGIFRHILPVILVFLVIAGCAKISSPTGGPKDILPPEIVKSVPVNGIKNFKGKKIVVTFNEYVTLDQINEKFMVSPPMKKKPEISLKGKSIIIEYEGDLRDSTTYTFYFQDAIRDLNEGNVFDNYSFVFSTGPVIDSLSVTGNVYTALTLDPPENVLIMLYSELTDSAFIKHIPDYISRADAKGYFRIDNVREGKYKLYALKDADNSKNFNLPDEEIAFLDSILLVSSERNYLPVIKDTIPVKRTESKVSDTIFLKGEHKLILFQPPKTKYYLTSSSRSQAYKLNYTLSLPPDTSAFDFTIPGAPANSYIIERSKENDTLQIWLTDSSLYSRQIIDPIVSYPFTDTTGKVIQKQDTTHMRFLIPRTTRSRQKPTPYKITSSFSAGSLRPGQQVIFYSQTPFRPPDTSKIRLYEVIEKDRIKVPFTLKSDTANYCRIFMISKLSPGKNYLFIADSASFGNIYGEQTDSTGYKFSVRSNDAFGKVTLTVRNFEGNRIIQLLTGDEKPVREIQMKEDGKTEFPLLDKGTYRLRVIYDINGNRKWTTGDFNTKRQPEPVSYMPREIEIKENWENSYDWDISEKNVKIIKNVSPKNKYR